jgi:hypothetical protein
MIMALRAGGDAIFCYKSTWQSTSNSYADFGT